VRRQLIVNRGPNWIHGTKDNPIADIATQIDTTTTGWDEGETLIDPYGKPVDATEADEYTEALWDDGLIAEAFRYSKTHQDSIDPRLSLADFFEEKFESLFLDQSPEVAKKKRDTLRLVSSTWGAYIGSPIHRQSLRFYWLEECLEGENLFVADTYREILQVVAKAALAKADIRLNTKVVSITANTIRGLGHEHTPKITLVTESGTMEFDEVVITTPLGWLKRNLNAFSPPLHNRLSQAINNIGYGTLDKVYITFPSAFWDVRTTNVQNMPNGIDPRGTTPNVKATTTPLHQPSSHDTETHYAGFTHWLSPQYASTTNPDGWDQETMNLAALPGRCAHPTLLFYIYGPCSVHIARIVTNAKSNQDLDANLIQFFKPYYSTLPNYDSSNPDCVPKAVLATAWASDEFAGYGSYSNFQVGLESGAEDIEVMRHGMPDRGVWFAGEHTAPFESSGTTTGAFVSGEAVARRIIETHGKGKE
jgi:hypothetical protein